MFGGGNILMSGPDEHEDDLETEVVEGAEIETETYPEDEDPIGRVDDEGPSTADVADEDQEGDANDTI